MFEYRDHKHEAHWVTFHRQILQTHTNDVRVAASCVHIFEEALEELLLKCVLLKF